MTSNNTMTSTNWDKTLFNFFGGYLTYGRQVGQTKFVARFKYTRRDRSGFQKFLIQNFTPAEYFSRLDAGEAPAQILKTKGYVSATVKLIQKLA